MTPRRLRCAIYTRKSSEDGLEQDFNSLDAQREACAAYITSQKAEGWVLVPESFDDGGLSGGTLERPALQALLRAIEAGQVDQVVVYKIDRLTRSLTDFAKIVDRLDEAEATFVSVTQSFNTATSMGRLTLNMLLSFAQFEREVTAERIRDKIGASKRKGLWMGGSPPMGYVPSGRTLVIDEAYAPTIRTLYDLYLIHRSLRTVQREAAALGLRTRVRAAGGAVAGTGHAAAATATSGKPSRNRGGVGFAKGHIHAILSNPIYAGRIRHRTAVYPGQHPALIDPATWEKVQDLLQHDAARARGTSTSVPSAPLLGKLFDETGEGLTPTHTTKSGKRLAYYVSRRLIGGAASDHPDGWRLPAPALEATIAAALHSHLTTPTAVATLVPEVQAGELGRLQTTLEEAVQPLLNARKRGEVLEGLFNRVDLAPGRMVLRLNAARIADLLDLAPIELDPDALTVTRALELRRRGNETCIILGALPATADPTLLDNIHKARAWYGRVKAGETFTEIATSEGHSRSRVQHMIGLAFLAPDILEAIVAGTHPLGLTSEWIKRHDLPADWVRQRALIARL